MNAPLAWGWTPGSRRSGEEPGVLSDQEAEAAPQMVSTISRFTT